MLLTGDWVVPASSPSIADGAVLVAEGAIVEVGPAAELRARYPDAETREFPGCALLPGLVNAHTHLDYSAFRGFSPSSGFSRWIWRLLEARRKLDTDDLAASALWGAYECLRNGVTSIGDTSYDGGTVARATRMAGLRARVYLEVFGLDDTRLHVTMERLEAALERVKRESGQVARPSVEWGISPHAPYTVSQGLYREAARFARRAGLNMATHMGESRAEVSLLAGRPSALAFAYKAAHLWTGKRWKPPRLSPLGYLAGSEALGPDMLVVHSVHVDGTDIATLGGSGAAVAHCPRSNLRLRTGAAPVAEMRAAGINVGLGTDSLASNDSLDMLAEMMAALEVSRGRASREGAPARGRIAPGADDGQASANRSLSLSPTTVLSMATLEGARALGWGHLVGSLESGKRADLAVIRLPGEGSAVRGGDAKQTEGSLGDVLVEEIIRGRVQMTMVDGKVVYEGTEIPTEAVLGLNAVRAKLGLEY